MANGNIVNELFSLMVNELFYYFKDIWETVIYVK